MQISRNEIIVLVIVITMIFLAASFFLLLYVNIYNKRKNKMIAEKKMMEAQLLQTQIEIQEQTLKTISQEIHDNVGQVLSLAKLHLGTFENTESEFNRNKINDTKQLVSKAINDLRDLSRSMHGDKIAELGLQEAIANELKILQNTGLFQTALVIKGNMYRLSPQNEMVLFRIVQEGLNNAMKYSKAKNINIEMFYQPDVFKLSISDDGVGFDKAVLEPGQTGLGLKSMQNRAALIGATLSLESEPQKGTRISVEIENNGNTIT